MRNFNAKGGAGEKIPFGKQVSDAGAAIYFRGTASNSQVVLPRFSRPFCKTYQ